MPAESAVPPVTFGVKVTRETPGHIHFNLFAGEQARGMAGSLTMRPAEFDAFLDRLKPEATHHQRPGPPGYTVIDETHRWTAGDREMAEALRRYYLDAAVKQDHEPGGESTDG